VIKPIVSNGVAGCDPECDRVRKMRALLVAKLMETFGVVRREKEAQTSADHLSTGRSWGSWIREEELKEDEGVYGVEEPESKVESGGSSATATALTSTKKDASVMAPTWSSIQAERERQERNLFHEYFYLVAKKREQNNGRPSQPILRLAFKNVPLTDRLLEQAKLEQVRVWERRAKKAKDEEAVIFSLMSADEQREINQLEGQTPTLID